MRIYYGVKSVQNIISKVQKKDDLFSYNTHMKGKKKINAKLQNGCLLYVINNLHKYEFIAK